MRTPAFALHMMVTGLAFAASIAAGGTVVAQDVVVIGPDETVLVERYVRALPEPPPIIEEHLTLRPGSVIPEGVPLRPFQGESKLERLAFFVSVDHKIVVADPRTRIVVRILDENR